MPHSDGREHAIRHEFPPVGARVRVTHYRRGNVIGGDHRDSDYSVVGRVVESPGSGHHHFIIRPPSGVEFPAAPFPVVNEVRVPLPFMLVLGQSVARSEFTIHEAAAAYVEQEQRVAQQRARETTTEVAAPEPGSTEDERKAARSTDTTDLSTVPTAALLAEITRRVQP